MAKARILKLVPSGSKLSEVSLNVEMLAALSASLMAVYFEEHADRKDKVVAFLKNGLTSRKLTDRQKATLKAAIRIVKSYP
jgi:predicted DNA binding protein